MACCKCKTRKAALITLWISFLIFILTIVIIVLFPRIYNMVLKKELTLTKGSIITGIWQDIPLPIHEKVYYFNITNPKSFLDGSEPMHVSEVGPYTYKSKWVKKMHWHSNNTVTYKEVRTYQFVPEKSNGTEDDVIVTLNGPFIIAASIVKSYPVYLRAAVSVILGIEGEKVIIERTVRELTYEGYEDFIIKLAPYIKPGIPYKEGKFSWLYGKNATNDGKFTVFTGAGDASMTNIINNWNGQEQLNFWKGDECNMINGTSIEVGPPITEGQQTYTFFQSIFCRSLTFNYTEDVTHYGVDSKRFRPTYDLFANETENPSNYCFDIDGQRPSGVLNISPCQFGAPAFISFPHFHLADPSYLNSVVGLNPNDKIHGSHIDVEIVTGVSIDLSVKFQINLEIQDIYGILQLEKVPKGIFPILWVDLNLEIDQHFADFLKNSLNNPKVIGYSVLGALACLCLLLSISCFIALCWCKLDRDDDDCLIDATEDIARIIRDDLHDHECCDDDDDKLLGNDLRNRNRLRQRKS